MSDASTMIGDMPANGWIDRFAPSPARPYLKLMRLDRPIGTWLLLLPCWWGIALAGSAAPGVSPWRLLWLGVLFGIGAVVMRGAGCTVNDILDRDIDAKVARTAARPLACGAVSVRQAMVFLALQLAVGAAVVVQLDKSAVVLGLAACLLAAVYPLMKRLTDWPQAWLGLTFNFGVWVGWAAVTGTTALPPLLLYVAGLFWTLGYDTLYAHQDKEDDVAAGVKSSALALGAHTRPAVAGFYALTLALLAGAAWMCGLGWGVWPLLAATAAHFVWQLARVDLNAPASCLWAFRSNREAGLIILAALVAGLATR